MKEALKRKMMEMKDSGHGGDDDMKMGMTPDAMTADEKDLHDEKMGDDQLADKSQSEHDDQDPAGPAPDLHSSDDKLANDEHALGDDAKSMDELKGADKAKGLHLEIMKGLSDHSHIGRSSMKLSERAADGVKAKMASIEKAKKGY